MEWDSPFSFGRVTLFRDFRSIEEKEVVIRGHDKASVVRFLMASLGEAEGEIEWASWKVSGVCGLNGRSCAR